MAKVTYDYTATEIQADIDAGRDFELEHDENRIVVEIPKGKLNMMLKKADGVLMADGHECRLGDYVDIIAETTNKVLASLRVRGEMTGTGIRGMKGSQIGALKGIINNSLKNLSDTYIQETYFPGVE